jgi:hypothetical protein
MHSAATSALNIVLPVTDAEAAATIRSANCWQVLGAATRPSASQQGAALAQNALASLSATLPAVIASSLPPQPLKHANAAAAAAPILFLAPLISTPGRTSYSRF